jgi:Antitoxin Xre/MbcA/ParS C-terminal toxin-binding domain
MHNLDCQQQVDLTIQVMALLDNWQLNNVDKITLLALPEKTRPRTLQRYAQHAPLHSQQTSPKNNLDGSPLPLDQSMLERIEHLHGIAHSLRLANPRNSQAGALWIRRPQPRLQGSAPLAIMLNKGLAGLITVRKHLDCSYDWYTDQQSHLSR